MDTSIPLGLDASNMLMVPTLSIVFDLPLQQRQISQWRGAFIEMAGRSYPLLHNHQEDGSTIYQYPRVQYRIRNGKAAIFAIGEGVKCIQQVLAERSWVLNWQSKALKLAIHEMKHHDGALGIQDTMMRYHISNYLALNQENYQDWLQRESLLERIQILERLLRNHLLACMWGLGWESETELNVKLIELSDTKQLIYHSKSLMAFDLVFTSNAQIPAGIAAGKAVSFGFGNIQPM